MYARNVSINMRPNSVAEFSRIFEAEITSLLRTQPGFRGEFAFRNESGTHVTAISIWKSKEQADAYQVEGYAQTLQSLASV